MTPTYQFVTASSQIPFTSNWEHLANGLNQLRTSAEFRAIEASVAEKYDNVVVVMGDNVVPFQTVTGTRFQETTGASGKTAYIYIDTSTTSVVTEDGIYKSLTAEQIFTHALAHSASDLPADSGFWTIQVTPTEAEAINRTNIVTQEAGLNGPRDTGTPQFIKNDPSPTFPTLKFQNGDEAQRGDVTLPSVARIDMRCRWTFLSTNCAQNRYRFGAAA